MPDDQVLRKECIQLWRSGTKQRTITAAGFSMYPLIKEGSTLTFVPAEADRSIAAGDIALFERQNTLVAHRVMGRFYKDGSLWFYEKGDNTFMPGCFSAACLVGRIVSIECDGNVRDLTRLRSRFAARMICLYWNVLFSLLRGASACKRLLVGPANTPRLRSFTVKAFRKLSRLPTTFTKR